MLRDLLLRYQRTILLTLALALPLASIYFHGKPRTESTIMERTMLSVTAPGQAATDGALRSARELLDGYVLLTGVNNP